MAAPPIPPLQPPPLSPLRSQRHDLMHHIGPPSVAASQLRCRVTVAVVASAPLLFLLAIVIGLCCRRICAPQDALYSVGTVDLVNVLRKARAADVRVRLTLSSVAVVIAWAIFVLVNDVSMLKCDEWLIPAPVRGWLNQVPLLVLLALRPVDRAGIRITATFFTMLALFYAFMDYTFLKNHWIPEAEAAHWTPAATAAVCFQAFNIPRWAVFVPGCLSVVLLCRTSTRGALRRLWCLQLFQRVVGALIAFPQATSSLLAGEPVPDFLGKLLGRADWGVCNLGCISIPRSHSARRHDNGAAVRLERSRCCRRTDAIRALDIDIRSQVSRGDTHVSIATMVSSAHGASGFRAKQRGGVPTPRCSLTTSNVRRSRRFYLTQLGRRRAIQISCPPIVGSGVRGGQRQRASNLVR